MLNLSGVVKILYITIIILISVPVAYTLIAAIYLSTKSIIDAIPWAIFLSIFGCYRPFYRWTRFTLYWPKDQILGVYIFCSVVLLAIAIAVALKRAQHREDMMYRRLAIQNSNYQLDMERMKMKHEAKMAKMDAESGGENHWHELTDEEWQSDEWKEEREAVEGTDEE